VSVSIAAASHRRRDRRQRLGRARLALLAADVLAHHVRRDAEQPRLDRRVAAKPGRRAMGLEERDLDEVLGVGAAREPAREPEHVAVVAIEQRAERGLIARRDRRDEGAIRELLGGALHAAKREELAFGHGASRRTPIPIRIAAAGPADESVRRTAASPESSP
jgi:hypothetical protein